MNASKVVLITGASSGMGRATAALLATRGYRVFGTARNPAGIEPIANVDLLPLDVRDDASVGAFMDTLRRKTDRIDILVNNAGYSGLVGAVEETTPADAKALFDTNLFGVLRMVRAVLPVMRRQRSGLIINTSSILGFLPGPFFGLYAASKHALEALSESLDHEVRDLGIRVALIEPNVTNTPFGAGWSQPNQQIEDYRGAGAKAARTMAAKIAKAAGPDTVAREILAAIEQRHHMRRTVGFEAGLLKWLRRLLPAGAMDRGIRKSFGLA